MRIRAVAMVLGAAVVLSGCGPRCSLEALLQEEPGPGSIDCGYVARDGDRAEINACVAAALNGGKAFTARYELQGNDSHVVKGFLGVGDGSVVRLGYDANLDGGLFSSWEYVRRESCSSAQLIDELRLEAGEFPPFECEEWVSQGMACQTSKPTLFFAATDQSQ